MVTELFDICGSRVLVTGGTRGLGKSIAEAFLEAGCRVAAAGTTDRVFEQAAEYNRSGWDCFGIKGDLGEREQVNRVYEEAAGKLGGHPDVLVTAHGIQRRHAAEEFPLEDWDQVLNVNLTSSFLLCREAGRHMLERGRGKIILIASMNSFFGGQTIPAYAAAKGGIAQLTKALSNDWAGRGVNVNAIAPGYMETDMNAALLDPENPRFASISERIPMGRWGTGDDLKGLAVFLASPASDYISGAVIPADGGYLGK